MTFKPIYSFDESMEGKVIRFRNSFSAPNMTSQFGLNKKHTEELHIPVGGLGMVYEIRGARNNAAYKTLCFFDEII